MCNVCHINLIGEESMKSHFAGKRHKRALERTVYIKGVYSSSNAQDLALFLESKVGKVLNCTIFPYYSLVEFENRSSTEEILKGTISYRGHELLIKPERRYRENNKVEPIEKFEYDQLQEVLEKSLAYTMNNDFKDKLSILLEQVVVKDPEQEDKVNELCRSLEKLFHPVFPDCKATAFGSVVTGLFFVGCDVDIVLFVSGTDETLHAAEDLVKVGKRLMFSCQNQFSKIGLTRAKIPVIKFVHIPTRIQCHLSFSNILSLQNSRLLTFIVSSDERIRKMMLFLKYWFQKHCIALNIRLGSYTIVLLAIFYLQQGKDPLLPAIRDLRDPQAPVPVDSWDTNFQVNSNYKFTSNNKESTENLLAGFFRFYAGLNWVNTVISPLLGLLIPRESFLPENLDKLPTGLELYKTVTSAGAKPLVITDPICVQDIFELNRNVTHTECGKYFQNLCNAAVPSLLNGPDNVQLPPVTKLVNSDLYYDHKRKSNSRDNCSLVMKARGYLKTAYLGSYSIDNGSFSRWANIVFNFIEVVFQDILKFNVTLENPVGVKVQKTDASDNVHSQQCVLICHGIHGVYHNRNKIRKMIQGKQNWFQQLAQISEKMIAMNEAISIDLEFRCILQADQKNDNLIVKLENLNNSVDFATAASFISQVLFKWTDKALKCGLALNYFSTGS